MVTFYLRVEKSIPITFQIAPMQAAADAFLKPKKAKRRVGAKAKAASKPDGAAKA